MIPIDHIGSFLALGASSGTRASLTFLVLALLARFGWVEVPPHMAILTSNTGLGLLAGLAVLEGWIEGDDDFQELLSVAKYGIHGTGGLLVSYAFLDHLALPLEGWPLAIIGGVLAIVTHGLRMRIHDALRGIEAGLLSPRRWLSWLEGGGVIGAALAAVLAPWIAMGFVIVSAMASVSAILLARQVERRNRRACSCGFEARREARRCAECGEALEVQQSLQPGRAWKAVISAVSDSGASTKTL